MKRSFASCSSSSPSFSCSSPHLYSFAEHSTPGLSSLYFLFTCHRLFNNKVSFHLSEQSIHCYENIHLLDIATLSDEKKIIDLEVNRRSQPSDAITGAGASILRLVQVQSAAFIRTADQFDQPHGRQQCQLRVDLVGQRHGLALQRAVNGQQTIESDGLIGRQWEILDLGRVQLGSFVHGFASTGLLSLRLLVVEHAIVFDRILRGEIDGDEKVFRRQWQIASVVRAVGVHRVFVRLFVGRVRVEKLRNAHGPCVD